MFGKRKQEEESNPKSHNTKCLPERRCPTEPLGMNSYTSICEIHKTQDDKLLILKYMIGIIALNFDKILPEFSKETKKKHKEPRTTFLTHAD